MTTPVQGHAASGSQGDSRRPSDRLGDEQRAEGSVGDIDPAEKAAEAVPVQPYAGWLTVSEGDRVEVEKISTLLGANANEEDKRDWDATDAEALLTYAPDLARMLARAQVDARPKRQRKGLAAADGRIAENHEIARQRLDRFARELIGWTWEARRLRIDRGPVRSDKYTDGAAWSPEALRVILAPDGTPREGTPWSNTLTLEHVVPASTIARLLASMHAAGKTSTEVAEALRGSIHQVVVKKGRTEHGRRDEPAAKGMHPDMEKKLIRHFLKAEGHKLDAAELFTVTWSRYLDPQMRGSDAHAMDWQVGELRTVTGTLGVHESER